MRLELWRQDIEDDPGRYELWHEQMDECANEPCEHCDGCETCRYSDAAPAEED